MWKFKVEGENGLFDVYEEKFGGDLVVSRGNVSIRCCLVSEGVAAEAVKDIRALGDTAATLKVAA